MWTFAYRTSFESVNDKLSCPLTIPLPAHQSIIPFALTSVDSMTCKRRKYEKKQLSMTYISAICNIYKKGDLLENVFYGLIKYFKSKMLRHLQNSDSFLNSSWNILAST